jgi:hypothetical protein
MATSALSKLPSGGAGSASSAGRFRCEAVYPLWLWVVVRHAKCGWNRASGAHVELHRPARAATPQEVVPPIGSPWAPSCPWAFALHRVRRRGRSRGSESRLRTASMASGPLARAAEVRSADGVRTGLLARVWFRRR